MFFILFVIKYVQCAVGHVEKLVKIYSYLKKNECMLYRIIFYKGKSFIKK